MWFHPVIQRRTGAHHIEIYGSAFDPASNIMCRASVGNHSANAPPVLPGGSDRLCAVQTQTNGVSMKKWLIGVGVIASVGFGIWSLYVASRY
jgi:hypothetical protein